ncbi:MAG: DUF4838 domain-containing protein [Oscillospiraceae bacterium]|nr:DUF4838 domain-containing protein [Oscillospiraceae bacterium]MDD4545682.1 DUF4838 domain-containing protein [Oscillospiraceae bacterium]
MFNYKGLVIYQDEISSYWNGLLLKSDLNLIGIHPVGGLTGGRAVDEAIENIKRPETQALLNELKSHNINIEYEMHALSWLLPRELFQTHPDWFRMNDRQERVNDYNLCPSNKDALDYVSQRAAILANIFTPTTNRYHFWLDDHTDSKCRCHECTKLTASDSSLLVYNAILKGIKTVNPLASQCYLAYHDTLIQPSCVEPEPGIFLEYAPMNRDLNIPLSDKSSVKNAGQIKPLDDLLGFFGTKNAKALDYWLDNSYFSEWEKPMKYFTLNKDVVKRDAEFYRNKGFDTATCFACFLGEEYYNLYNEFPNIQSYCDAIR